MNLSNLLRFGALVFLLTSESSAKADSEALSAIATLPCDELGYNNLSRNSQGDAPFGIPLRQWDQEAVSSIYDRIRACSGEIDPVQARLAQQQGSRFLDGIVRRAASARAGAQRDVALMETIQKNLADIETSTLPPDQILSKLDGVQAGVQAVSRALPPDIRDAFQRRIDAKRAALNAVLQAQAEREQKAAEDRFARLRAAADTAATVPPGSPSISASSGDPPSDARQGRSDGDRQQNAPLVPPQQPVVVASTPPSFVHVTGPMTPTVVAPNHPEDAKPAARSVVRLAPSGTSLNPPKNRTASVLPPADEGPIADHPILSILIAIYILVAGVIVLPLVRRPVMAWYRSQRWYVRGKDPIDILFKQIGMRANVEFFAFMVACLVGALGGWIYVFMRAQGGKPAVVSTAD
ncbi:hypothetical protein D3273_19270 [Lichenibacterium minor]|uniref:Uncharacterized protein n=1 Tax=Lichenibacterium minor TaxID=2316528 RepID=A0A4Q2U2D3_9HYPH|nr:hypothetical protein [Lichenibacterium minor]RYC30310.1 hypothetical protein D3273_19270 [Lichenibacterium minor]